MLKGLVDWWARNPVAGNLLMLACAVAGALSFMRMEKEFWPPGRDDGIWIEATWPGASPEDMESQVTVRIEEATADLDGVNWVRSRSGEGYMWSRMATNPSVDVEQIVAEARSKIEAISGLPTDLEPIRVTRQVGRNWSIIIGLHGRAGERALRDTAEKLRQKIALLPGGANTIITGARQPEVSIELSEAALQRYGLTFDEVTQAVRGASINISAGAVRTQDGNYQLRARNLADSAFDFENIVLRQTPDGGIVRIGDVAEVIDGFQDVNLYSRMNGEPAILIAVQTGDEFNIWETSKKVRELIDAERAELPSSLQLTYVYDEAEDYSKLLDILFSNALQGFALIFLLLLLSLHPKVAFWATAGVVTAFAGSFFILPYVDVSLNFMTVFGFLLVLGIMVDDAIIVGESIYEAAERGESGPDAAVLATHMVLKPLVASVFVTMIAFLPWMLLDGEVRQFTRAISIVVMSTLIFSLIESLIILPAHLAHVKKPDTEGTGLLSRLFRFQQRCAHSVIWVAQNIHGPVLQITTRFRWVTLAAFVSVLVLAFAWLASGRVKQTFMPEVEGDFVQATIELPQTTPFGRMTEVAAQLDGARLALERETAKETWTDPNTSAPSHGVIRSWSQQIDEQRIQAWIVLTPPEFREFRSTQVQERLKELLGPVPDAERINFSISGNNNGPNIQIAILGENPQDLRSAVNELKARLQQFSAINSVRDSQEAAAEELRFTLLPGAEQTGVTLAQVTRQVRQAYFGDEVQRLPRDGDDVRVYVRYPRDDRRTLDSLGQFRIRTSDGREVPLSSIATVEFAPGVTGLDRRQRMSSIMVEAEAPPEARAGIMKELDETFFPQLEQRYPTITRKALGEAEAQAEFFSQLLSLGAMALFAMYFLLAVTFRSYWQPALIMSVIPFTFIGALVGHAVGGWSIALFSWLGMIAAVGVVVNDNVVLIDKANQFRKEGMGPFEAITGASVSRFRQIFLTSITEFIGLLPMLSEDVAIANFLKPMAVSLAFGVLLCMPVTLILTPTFYMIGKDVKSGVGGIGRFLNRLWNGPDPRTVQAE
ncbi:MAG: efflux RND transporter permease subunit [Hyphomonadaceae bacterium]|nr:efflux RND transporter permease subunit [Hyphomonadaceae bacterium]